MPVQDTSKKTKETGQTSLIQQYNDLKKKHPNTLLLCRVGDFYEAFGQDARKLSQVAEIVLTKYANGNAPSTDMAGFPYHALDTYIPKLIKAGLRVAISNQPPKSTKKGIIQREVVELVTPGLTYYDQVLDKKHNNYLAALHFGKDLLGIAFLDVSTGEFLVAQGAQPYIEKLIQSFNPSEIIFNKAEKKTFYQIFQDHYNNYALEEWVYHFEYGYERLNEHFKTTTLKGFGIEKLTMGIVAAGAILRYLEETKHEHLAHVNAIGRVEEEKYLWLDKFTIRNLELIAPQQEDGVSLIEVLDKTVTPMGARMLRKWVLLPLKEIRPIQKRLAMVAWLVEDGVLLQNIAQHLKQIGDIERLISKVATKRINPRELLALKKALNHTHPIQALLKQSGCNELVQLGKQLYTCDFLLEKINKTLQNNPPIVTNQGSLIQKGVHADLDELQEIVFQGKDYLQKLLAQAREKTGIFSLKIGYNKVFGFYLEVTHTHKDKVPASWIRKQTLVNAERYVTEELKDYEEKILSAQERMYALEQAIYNELVESTEAFMPQIQQNAKILAELDCYHCFAGQAKQHNYSRPVINDDHIIDIKEGRHPVIEQHLALSKKYVPNDVYLDSNNQQVLLITGPNMAGKSALLRQVALNILMAQIGAFVAAKKATIGVVDKIFTRVGASDNLAMGESTFMVEMQEMSSILNNLSERSLVIVDELGRGTSTADGFALAQATIEYIHSATKHQPKTLFATHYHELNQLALQLKRVKNFHVSVKEVDGEILFLHKLEPGSSPNSFGIHVARMAGMPVGLIQRAQQILKDFPRWAKIEGYKILADAFPQKRRIVAENNRKADLLMKALYKIDVNTLTPVEALLKLEELKLLLRDIPS